MADADEFSDLSVILSLIDLPDEILLKILSCEQITIYDLCNLNLTCSSLKRIVQTQNLWKAKFRDHWSDVWDELPENCDIVDWHDEVKQLVLFQREVHKMVCGLSERLFHYKHLTTPVYNEIDALAISTQRAPLYMISALRNIVQQGPEYKNLTEKHYALKVMSHVHQELCSQQWMQLLALPPHQQPLEIGAVYLAKWFQPYEHITVRKISAQIDGIAMEIRDKLSTQHPDHPVLNHNIFPPKHTLNESKWSPQRCRQIFKFINHVFYTQMKFCGNTQDYYHLKNSLMNIVLSSKCGIPISLSILYGGVCHRLGILLRPINYPQHFIMGWKIPGTEEYEYIDAFNKGRRLTLSELLDDLPVEQSNKSTDEMVEPCKPSQVFQRMIKNIMNVAQMQAHVSDHLELFCPATELLSLLSPSDRNVQELLLRIYYTNEVHYDRIVAGCEQLLATSGPEHTHSIQILQEMLQDSRHILQSERTAHHTHITSKDPRVPETKYTVGLVMKHKRYHYTCVIFGWDCECKMPQEWIRRMGVNNLQYQTMQPFYNVMVSDGSHRYAAQENLEVSSKPKPVSHADIGKYFKEFNGACYIPNDELKQEYPEDDAVRLEILRECGM